MKRTMIITLSLSGGGAERVVSVLASELAEKEYPLAECQVGYFYLEGYGVEKNLEKALYWTERAAQHGDRDAQFNLGWFYENGIVVTKDLECAKAWYSKAAAQQQIDALKKLK